ncbi:MAG TPA: transposase, partial [Bryobacteraceae bacterium]|nr:transposase [Bryobacteraceae bacterium]
SMIVLLRYGNGVPWNRLEDLEASLGIPLPSSTQCEILMEVAVVLEVVLQELIRQAAQGEVVHNVLMAASGWAIFAGPRWASPPIARGGEWPDRG